ncbi:hypothetical protein V6N13_050001 [Hibiscus sabdariffa]
MANHAELPVPIYSSLEPVYGEGSQLEEAKLRFERLKSKFLQVFGHPPEVFARSPEKKKLPFCSISRLIQALSEFPLLPSLCVSLNPNLLNLHISGFSPLASDLGSSCFLFQGILFDH